MTKEAISLPTDPKKRVDTLYAALCAAMATACPTTLTATAFPTRRRG